MSNIIADLLNTERIDELANLIEKHNLKYRNGIEDEESVSDEVYDSWIDELESLVPTHPVLVKVGYQIPLEDKERMQNIPVPMASMKKNKTIEEITKWRKSKGISDEDLMTMTPKLDGLSFAVNERNGDGWSRGDGLTGLYSPEHYKLIQHRPLNDDNRTYDFYAVGEVIMARKIFEENKFLKDDGKPFKNPRNLVSAKIIKKKTDDILKYCVYIRYGLFSDTMQYNKDEQLIILNTINPHQIPYVAMAAGDITEEILNNLFKEWNVEFEIDGIIIEVNDYHLREKIGREQSTNNPGYARAFKGKFEDSAETTVVKVPCEVSKQGFLKPTVRINPVQLNGVTVSNPTGNNYKFIRANGIGPGAVIRVMRSGMVIPKIVEVLQPVPFEMPTECPECKGPVEWNETEVEICCINIDCPAQKLMRMVSFFKIIGVDKMGEGICEQLYNAGYDTIHKIVSMSQNDMKALDRFGDRKSEVIFNNIKNALTDISLSKLQHASGCFRSLGSKKLELLTHLNKDVTVDEIKAIKGFSDTLAFNYITGRPKFENFINGLSVTIKQSVDEVEITSDKCKNWIVVFTGFTDENLEKKIKERSGKIGSSVNKKTTHLVIKEKGSGSSKEVKATELNVPVFNIGEFMALLEGVAL